MEENQRGVYGAFWDYIGRDLHRVGVGGLVGYRMYARSHI